MQDFIQLQQVWGGGAGREISLIESKEVSIFKRIQIFQRIIKEFTSKAWATTAAFPDTKKFKRKTLSEMQQWNHLSKKKYAWAITT